MELKDLIITKYQILGGDPYDVEDVTLDRCRQLNGSIKWAIREHGCCLDKQGEWELEPIPSSRTEDFFKRCRWDSAEEALAFWVKNKCDSRFAHYRNLKQV